MYVKPKKEHSASRDLDSSVAAALLVGVALLHTGYLLFGERKAGN